MLWGRGAGVELQVQVYPGGKYGWVGAVWSETASFRAQPRNLKTSAKDDSHHGPTVLMQGP